MDTVARRQVFIIDFGSLAGGATEYSATNPIVGRGRIISLQFACMRATLTDLPTVTYWVYWGTEVPTSAGEFRAGEPVFPEANRFGAAAPLVQQSWEHPILRLDGPFSAGPMGRRLTVSAANGAITAGRVWVGMVWERGVALERGRRIDD
jgi:hypothetical protein